MSIRYFSAKFLDAVLFVAVGLGLLIYASDALADVPANQPAGGPPPPQCTCPQCYEVGQTCGTGGCNGCWHTHDMAWSPCNCCGGSSNGDGGCVCTWSPLLCEC
jgi:hypothetical protein